MQDRSEQTHINKKEKSDSELIRLAKGDINQFAHIYNKYWESVYRFIYRRVANDNLVKDIAQDVFVKAMQKINKYEDRGFALSSWLYRIAMNEVTDAYRRNEKEMTLKTQVKDLNLLIEEVYDSAKDEETDRMLRALEGLKPVEIQMIQMRYFEKRKLKEVAEIINMSESSCKVKMFRIVTKLREKLC